MPRAILLLLIAVLALSACGSPTPSPSAPPSSGPTASAPAPTASASPLSGVPAPPVLLSLDGTVPPEWSGLVAAMTLPDGRFFFPLAGFSELKDWSAEQRTFYGGTLNIGDVVGFAQRLQALGESWSDVSGARLDLVEGDRSKPLGLKPSLIALFVLQIRGVDAGKFLPDISPLDPLADRAAPAKTVKVGTHTLEFSLHTLGGAAYMDLRWSEGAVIYVLRNLPASQFNLVVPSLVS